MQARAPKKQIPNKIVWSERSGWTLEPQQERSRRTLMKILDAAASLFMSNGYENTTVADIAAAANISAGSVYRRFSDKEAVLYTVLDSYFKTRVAEFDRLIEESALNKETPEEILKFYVDMIFSAYRQDGDIIRLYERRALGDETVREMAAKRSQYVASRMGSLLYPHLPWSMPRIDEMMIRLHSTLRGTLVHLILPDAPASWPGLTVESDAFKDDMARMALAWFDMPVTPAR